MADGVTLKDVAREAGVHVSTASRALSPDTRSVVNVETARRVAEVAERLGYRPHPLARGLRTNRTHTIGMIVPDLMNPLFSPIYAGAEERLSESGYSLVIASDGDDEVKAKDVVAGFLERRVDGLILATAHLDNGIPSDAEVGAAPVVLVNRAMGSERLPTIVGDDCLGIGLAVQHLASLGHTAIAHIAGPQDLSTGVNRRQAFDHAIEQEGLVARPEMTAVARAFRVDDGRDACRRLLDSGVEVTAIVAGNDLIALGCYDALAERGLTIPGDVSVTGYNDMAFIDRVTPPLTSVAVPYRAMGAEAAAELLRAIDGEGERAATTIFLPPSLVVRKSTAPPRTG
jgi:LacI family transcriptional regulator